MKIKKLLALSLASIMALGVLTGCGGNQDAQGGSSAEGGSGDVVEISFPTHWVGVSVTTEWFQDRLAAFNEQYGDQITFMGGVDSASVDYPGWTPEVVEKEVRTTCETCGTKFFIPNTSQGAPMTTYPGVYDAVSAEIDKMSRKMFG